MFVHEASELWQLWVPLVHSSISIKKKKKGTIKVSVTITCITVFFAKTKQVKTELRRNPLGNRVILLFS